MGCIQKNVYKIIFWDVLLKHHFFLEFCQNPFLNRTRTRHEKLHRGKWFHDFGKFDFFEISVVRYF